MLNSKKCSSSAGEEYSTNRTDAISDPVGLSPIHARPTEFIQSGKSWTGLTPDAVIC